MLPNSSVDFWKMYGIVLLLDTNKLRFGTDSTFNAVHQYREHKQQYESSAMNNVKTLTTATAQYRGVCFADTHK